MAYWSTLSSMLSFLKTEPRIKSQEPRLNPGSFKIYTQGFLLLLNIL